MSLTVALRTALSALQTTQSQLQVTSNNIANVNTAGYTRKTQTVSSIVLDGTGAGVRADTIKRTVDAFLSRQVRDQASTSSMYTVMNQYLQSMQDQFGTPADNTSLTGSVSSLASALAALANTPESPTQASAVIGQAQLLAQQLNAYSSSLQGMRADTDKAISAAVTDINTALDRIGELNAQIMRAKALNQGLGDLQDQRDQLVRQVSEFMDVRSYERDNGEMVLMTGAGRRLVDGNQVEHLSHTSSASLGASTTYIDPSVTGFYNTGGVAGIYLGTPPDTTNGTNDITSEIANGKLKALIDLRDDSLPGMQSSLDELATQLRDALNAAHNNGAAFPPPTTLTGSQSVVGTDPFNGAGAFRIALVNTTTGAVANVADINLAGLTTVNQVINAINTAAGLGGNVTASIVGGKLQLATGNGTGIVINENTSAIPVGDDTRGLSQYFGLNDLYVAGNNYASYDSNVQTSATAALGITGPLTFQFGASTVSVAVAATDSIADIAAAINGTAALTAAGIRAGVIADASGFRLRVADSGGDNFLLSSAGTAVTGLGMTAQRVGSAAQIAVRQTLVTNPNLVTRGDVSTTAVVGDLDIGSGDADAAQRLADVFSASLAFPANGNNLPALNATLGGFATQVISSAATQASTTSSQLDFAKSLLTQLDTRLQNDSGVNLDEELANLTVLQNAYGAAARVITVTNDLFGELTNLLR
ncbi:MAG: flagellar hook-associated protein FlgK [Alphaproteobacteria bacterium]|nr:flagellar hook-associated protein FlgK [Alphaproteobacteria bacterium]